MLKNDFYNKIKQAYINCASKEDLTVLLGKGRAKKGIFEGNLDEGDLEIGQVSARIEEIKSVKEIMQEIITDFNSTKIALNNFDF